MAHTKDNNDKTDAYIIVESLKRLLNNWKFILKAVACGLLFGIVLAFSMPREYGVNVKLSMENAAFGDGAVGAGSIASMLGYGTGNGTSEAIRPSLYDKIITSTPFVKSLYDVPLKMSGKSSPVSVYEYFDKYYKNPWWKTIINFFKNIPKKGYRWFKNLTNDDFVESSDSSSNSKYLRMSVRELDVVSRYTKTVSLTTNSSNGLYSLNVSAQDPLVSVQLSDTILSRLYQYVYDYRQAKDKQELEYIQGVYDDLKVKYQKAQTAYSDFIDHNRDINLQSTRARLNELQNDVSLLLGLYNSISQKMEDLKSKMQRNTSIFSVIQPAVVPNFATKPNKMVVIAGSMVLFAFGSILWILFVGEYVAYIRKYYIDGRSDE